MNNFKRNLSLTLEALQNNPGYKEKVLEKVLRERELKEKLEKEKLKKTKKYINK